MGEVLGWLCAVTSLLRLAGPADTGQTLSEGHSCPQGRGLHAHWESCTPAGSAGGWALRPSGAWQREVQPGPAAALPCSRPASALSPALGLLCRAAGSVWARTAGARLPAGGGRAATNGRLTAEGRPRAEHWVRKETVSRSAPRGLQDPAAATGPRLDRRSPCPEHPVPHLDPLTALGRGRASRSRTPAP